MIHDISKCTECNSTSIYFNEKNYEVICNKCGLVITDSLPEYNELKPLTKIYFNETKNSIRISYPNSMKSKEERALKDALDTLNLMASSMGFTELLKKASMDIFIQLYKDEKTKGKDRKLVIAGCSLIASRIIEYPLLLSDFKKVNLSEKHVSNLAKSISEILSIKLKPAVPESFTERYAVKLKLPNLTIAVIMKLIEKGREIGLFNNNMFNTVAGACILAGCRITRHQLSVNEVSKVTGIMEGTIMELAKEILWSVDEKEYERYAKEIASKK